MAHLAQLEGLLRRAQLVEELLGARRVAARLRRADRLSQLTRRLVRQRPCLLPLPADARRTIELAAAAAAAAAVLASVRRVVGGGG